MYRMYRKTKYHNRKTKTDGRTFDSQKEARRYKQLRQMELAGEISDLSTQVKFVLIPTQRDPITGKILERECSYIADFVYTVPQKAQLCTKSTTVVEDVKGYRTDVYRIKKKLMLLRFGIVIKEV